MLFVVLLVIRAVFGRFLMVRAVAQAACLLLGRSHVLAPDLADASARHRQRRAAAGLRLVHRMHYTHIQQGQRCIVSSELCARFQATH
jgi:hypothetical protein